MAIMQTKVSDSNLPAISSAELSRLLQEGIVAGVIGAGAIAVWFLRGHAKRPTALHAIQI